MLYALPVADDTQTTIEIHMHEQSIPMHIDIKVSLFPLNHYWSSGKEEINNNTFPEEVHRACYVKLGDATVVTLPP